MTSHAGGKKDEAEDDTATALREAHEEIGAALACSDASCQEHQNFELRPNAGVADAIFHVPLEMVLKSHDRRSSTSFM